MFIFLQVMSHGYPKFSGRLGEWGVAQERGGLYPKIYWFPMVLGWKCNVCWGGPDPHCQHPRVRKLGSWLWDISQFSLQSMDCGWVFLGMEPHKGSMGQTPHARKNTLQIHVLFLILALWNLLRQGLVTVPFWVYWTSPKKVAMA